MLSDGTWTYTWEQGRQLKAMTDGTTNLSFTYDEEGKRVSKTVGSTVWKYVYNGSNLVYMIDGTNYLSRIKYGGGGLETPSDGR